MSTLPSLEVCRRRIIQDFAAQAGSAKIQADGKTFDIRYDDLADLAQAVEMIMLRLTGKLLRSDLRPEIKRRSLLVPTKVIGGDYSLYRGDDASMPAVTVCDVTGHDVRTHYLRVEIDGNAWDNWFGRLDELCKCLYIVVREAQGDPYVPKPLIYAHG